MAGIETDYLSGDAQTAAKINTIFDDILNIYHHGGNVLIGKTGTIYIPVIINNAGDAPGVYLHMWGKKGGATSNKMNHGAPSHYHGQMEAAVVSGETDWGSYDKLNSGQFWEDMTEARGFRFVGGDSTEPEIGDPNLPVAVGQADVPQAVEIWIDGTQYTASIGDPNTKGATMYDSVNDDWGTDGTTEWDTGQLDISSEISWTAGLHYIELKETGDTGGALIYHVSVNSGYTV